MLEVSLTYPTPDGSQEISLEGGRLTFGRGSEADQRFADDGLSRLHATVYRDGDRVSSAREHTGGATVRADVHGGACEPAGNMRTGIAVGTAGERAVAGDVWLVSARGGVRALLWSRLLSLIAV